MSVLYSALEKSRQARAESRDGSTGDADTADRTAQEAAARTLPLHDETPSAAESRGGSGGDGDARAEAGADSRPNEAEAPVEGRGARSRGGVEGRRRDRRRSAGDALSTLSARSGGLPIRRLVKPAGGLAVVGALAVGGWHLTTPDGRDALLSRITGLMAAVVDGDTYADGATWAATQVEAGASKIFAIVSPYRDLGEVDNGEGEKAAGADSGGIKLSVPATAEPPAETNPAETASGGSPVGETAPTKPAPTKPAPTKTAANRTASADPGSRSAASERDVRSDGHGAPISENIDNPDTASKTVSAGVGPSAPGADVADADAVTSSPPRPAPPKPRSKPEAVLVQQASAPESNAPESNAPESNAPEPNPGESSGGDGRGVQTADAGGAASDEPVEPENRTASAGAPTGLTPETRASDQAASAPDVASALKLETRAGAALTAGSHREAASALRNDNPTRAARIYLKILKDSPADPDALFGLALALTRMEMYDEARRAYADLLDVEPGHRQALGNLVSLSARGDPAKALQRLRRLADRHRGFAPIHAQVADIEARRGDLTKATAAMRRAVREAPENLRFRYNLAILYDRSNRRGAAIRAYRRVVEAIRRTGDAAGLPLDAVRARLRYLEG